MDIIKRLAEIIYSHSSGLSKKSAEKIALSMLNKLSSLEELGNILINISKSVQKCSICNIYCESNICQTCKSDEHKDLLCVFEDCYDFLNFNKSNFKLKSYILEHDFFSKIYTNSLILDHFLKRIQDENLKEVVIIFNTTMQGNAHMFFLSDLIKKENPSLMISSLSRGVPMGTQIDYIDELTLTQAFKNRSKID